MLFCPTCANILVISTETGYNKWACNTCAYEFPITKQVRLMHSGSIVHSGLIAIQMTSRTHLKRKEVDDVLGGDDTWKHADSTAGTCDGSLSQHIFIDSYVIATCPKCDHDRAYFYQLQIRSADEPMTTCMFFIWFTVLEQKRNLFARSLPMRCKWLRYPVARKLGTSGEGHTIFSATIGATKSASPSSPRSTTAAVPARIPVPAREGFQSWPPAQLTYSCGLAHDLSVVLYQKLAGRLGHTAREV